MSTAMIKDTLKPKEPKVGDLVKAFRIVDTKVVTVAGYVTALTKGDYFIIKSVIDGKYIKVQTVLTEHCELEDLI